MYSLLPLITSFLFITVGLLTLIRNKKDYIVKIFFFLCLTTFAWQFSWAILFQIKDENLAFLITKIGWSFILFLPTTLYHFLVLISANKKELKKVYFSYIFSFILFLFLIFTNLFISSPYQYNWGFYPKASILHPLHILQTVIIVTRGLYIAYITQKTASKQKQIRLRYCILSLFIFFISAIDYLCNYGFEFYPLGVIFIAISLTIISYAILRYNLLNITINKFKSLSGSIAHEMRNPLSAIDGGLDFIENEIKNKKPNIEQILEIISLLKNSTRNSLNLIDIILNNIRDNEINKNNFTNLSIINCVNKAISQYSFQEEEKELIQLDFIDNFNFRGDATLIIFVLFNLLKNSLYVKATNDNFKITITTKISNNISYLYFKDNGSGIKQDKIATIFDDILSSNKDGGTGLGLPFCKRVMKAFDGDIICRSKEDEGVEFCLKFPTN